MANKLSISFKATKIKQISQILSVFYMVGLLSNLRKEHLCVGFNQAENT